MGKPEGKVERALVARIAAIGGMIRKTCYIGRRGCPDRRAMVPYAYRRHLADLEGGPPQNPWVECKAEGERLEDHQAREIARMDALGELVLVIDSQADIDRYFPLRLPRQRRLPGVH